MREKKAPNEPKQVNAIIVHQSGKVLNNTNFLEIFEDLSFDVGNTDEEKVNPKEEKVKDNEVLKHFVFNKESLGKSSYPSMLYKLLELYKTPIPFLYHPKVTKHDKPFPKNFNILPKININLPLLDFIKDISSYPKFSRP